MKAKKILTNILCISLVASNVLPAMATYTEESFTYSDKTNDSQETEVFYNNGVGDYFVRIPKLITLGKEKTCSYSVEVNGDISSDKQVYVSPIDSLKDTDDFDFYMVDQSTVNQKTNVVATVNQNKFYWNFEEAKAGYIEENNSVSALSLSAGTWKGTFDFEINMRNSDGSEIHHHTFEDGVCTGCGERIKNILDLVDGGVYEIGTTISVQDTDTLMIDNVTQLSPYIFNAKGRYQVSAIGEDGTSSTVNIIITEKEHVHDYTKEKITKEATCTEEGEKELICSCGYRKTEVIPISTEHNYGTDNVCTDCGKEYDLYEIAPETAYGNWNYTLDDENDIITLNYYTGNETDVIVYTNYEVNDKIYKTQLQSSPVPITNDINKYPYMFNGSAKSNCKNIKSISFSHDIDTSNVTSMNAMFGGCNSLISLDISGFNTSNVTNMHFMFDTCLALTNVDLSNFDTSKVTTMRGMFAACHALTELDLRNFDTRRVTDMSAMFQYCKVLTNIYATSGKWVMPTYPNNLYMFQGTSGKMVYV